MKHLTIIYAPKTFLVLSSYIPHSISIRCSSFQYLFVFSMVNGGHRSTRSGCSRRRRSSFPHQLDTRPEAASLCVRRRDSPHLRHHLQHRRAHPHTPIKYLYSQPVTLPKDFLPCFLCIIYFSIYVYPSVRCSGLVYTRGVLKKARGCFNSSRT